MRLVVAVSEEARRSIAHYHAAPYRVIPNGVDTQRFSPDRTPHPEHLSQDPCVLFVGRPDPRKGVDVLLHAFELLQTDYPSARLLMAGITQQELSRFGGRAQNIEALGYVAPDALPSLYAAADVVCAPSLRQESQGIVLLEAMASGKVVVCFDIPGYRELVTHGVDAWVAAKPTPRALAAALKHALDSDALRRDIGMRARERAQPFAWPRVVDEIEQALLDACRSG